MAKRKIKMLLNLGTDDQRKYGLPELAEDEVVSLPEEQANVLVNVLKCAKDFDASEEKEHAESVRASDVATIRPAVEAEAARQEIQKAAEKEAKKK